MNLPLALHTAARRFCADRHYRWAAEYMELCKSGSDRAGSDYSDSAYGLFPRYRLDHAIEIEVERLTGTEFQSLSEAQGLLLEAGGHALSNLLREFQRSSLACVALNEEFKAFECHISAQESAQLSSVEPVPYRRALGDSEHKQLREALRKHWCAAGYWYPLAKCEPHLDVIAFHQELWEIRNGTSLLLRATQERSIERCFLLLEGPVDYEIDRSLIDPVYGGDEFFLTSDFEWLVYSSHESSITVAGWLAAFFRAQWPDWVGITYGGPFHTKDLRGSWNLP